MRRLTAIATMFLRRLRNAALAVGAVAGLACIVLAIASVAFDGKVLVFRSGSMAPAVEAGALGLTRSTPASELAVGDVVSVVVDGSRVTHRVVEVVPDGLAAELTLQGDANGAPDPEPYTVTAADRLVFDVPHLGRGVAWAAGPQGLSVIGVITGILLYMVFRNSPRIGGRHLATASVVVCVLAGVVVGTSTRGTLAYWADTGALNTGQFQAHVVAQPGTMNCTTGFLNTNITVSVPHGDDRYHYIAKVFNSSGTTQVSGTLVLNRSGAAWTRTLTFADMGLLALGQYRIRIYARLATATTWESVQYREWTINALTGLLVSCGSRQI